MLAATCDDLKSEFSKSYLLNLRMEMTCEVKAIRDFAVEIILRFSASIAEGV